MTIGIKQADGNPITGFSDAVKPDRNPTRTRTPRIRQAKFGDGYQQRKPIGINSLDDTINVSFSNRPAAEMDDLEAFFSSSNGVDKFIYTIPDTNVSPAETDIFVICTEWSDSTPQEGFRTITARLERVYEA